MPLWQKLLCAFDTQALFADAIVARFSQHLLGKLLRNIHQGAVILNMNRADSGAGNVGVESDGADHIIHTQAIRFARAQA